MNSVDRQVAAELSHQKDVKKAATRLRPLLFGWALFGVTVLLLNALGRLVPLALEALKSPELTIWHWGLIVGWSGANCYLEGYRGFQKRFVPRVIARAHYLEQHPTLLRVVLAPLFSMAYFQAERRAKIAAWIVTSFVLLAIFVVKQLPQPWRGIVDCGVICGLTWGLVFLAWHTLGRFLGRYPHNSPQMPLD
jgi:hypothetical protein